MLTRREAIAGLAASFALPLYPAQVNGSALFPPIYKGLDAPAALSKGLTLVQDLGQAYMLPGTDSGPVQDRAVALFRDANRIRSSSRNTRAMNQALEMEGMAAIIVGHVFAERGQLMDAQSWFRRATDAARIMWPDNGRKICQRGVDLATRAELLLWLDQGKHLTKPADTVVLTGRWIDAGAAGAARAMALSVRARAESLLSPASEPARLALVEAGKWAEIDSAPDAPLNLLGYTTRQHHYVAAGVYATLGYAEPSREHRAAYLDPALPKPGFMNACLLDLGEGENVLREHGPAAAATHVRQALERVPVQRRSAPLVNKAVAMTYAFHAPFPQSANAPQEVRDLGVYVNMMRSPEYLAAAA